MKPYPAEPGLPESATGHLSGQSGLYRSNMFEGRLLSAESLQGEQVYADLRLRQAALPWRDGVVRGLEVEVPDARAPQLNWHAGQPLKNGLDPKFSLLIRRGLGQDGQGTPVALPKDLEVPLRTLYDRFLREPTILTGDAAPGETRLAAVPWTAPADGKMPSGAYVLAARAVEVETSAGLSAGVEPLLIRIPWDDLPSVHSAWALRGALAAIWFDRERTLRWLARPGFEAGDPHSGAVAFMHVASPVGLAMIAVGKDESLLFCDMWSVRRPLLEPGAAAWGSWLSGASDAPARLAALLQFQHMLTESIAEYPATAQGEDLWFRGFVALPPVGFLPSNPGSVAIDLARLNTILEPAFALFARTNTLLTSELAPHEDALLELLAAGSAADPIWLARRAGLAVAATSLDVLVPTPGVRRKKGTSADGIDWADDQIRALDAFTDAGLRNYGLEHLVRRETELVRLIIVAQPAVAGRMQILSNAVGLGTSPFVAFVRHRVSLPLVGEASPVTTPRPDPVPGPRVRISSPTNAPTTGPRTDVAYGVTTASIRVGETLTIDWSVEAPAGVARQRMLWGISGDPGVEVGPVGPTLRTWPWPVDRGVGGRTIFIQIEATDNGGQTHTCQLDGLTVLAPVVVEVDPEVEITAPANGTPYIGSTNRERRTATTERVQANSVLPISWTLNNPGDLRSVTLSIGVVGGAQLFSYRWEYLVTSHLYPVPDEAHEGTIYVDVKTEYTENRKAEHTVYGLTFWKTTPAPTPIPLVNITWPPNSGLIDGFTSANGKYTYATSTIQGGEPMTITWEVTPGASRIVRQNVQIGSIDGQLANYNNTDVPAEARSWPWPTPAERPDLHQARTWGFWVFVNAMALDNSGGYHQVRNITLLSAQTTPTLELTVERYGLFDYSSYYTASLERGDSAYIGWRVSNATGALVFDIQLYIDGALTGTIVAGIAPTPTPTGLYIYELTDAQTASLAPGYNRTIVIEAREPGTTRTGKATSPTFVVVEPLIVSFVDRYNGLPWRVGYLWTQEWQARGGTAQQGGNLQYAYRWSVAIGSTPSSWTETSATTVPLFLPGQPVTSGWSAIEATWQVAASVSGGYGSDSETTRSRFSDPPRAAGWRALAAGRDHAEQLFARLNGVLTTYEGLLIPGEITRFLRHYAILDAAFSVTFPWCRPADLVRSSRYDPSTSRFAHDQGVDPIGSLAEGYSLIELLDAQPELADQMCEAWMTDSYDLTDVVGNLTYIASKLSDLVDQGTYNLAQFTSGGSDWTSFVTRWVSVLEAERVNPGPVIQYIGPDAFLRLLYAAATNNPRTVVITSPSSGQSVYTDSTFDVVWSFTGNWRNVSSSVTVSGAGIYQRYTVTSGTTRLQIPRLSAEGGADLTLTCTDEDGYTLSHNVSITLAIVGT